MKNQINWETVILPSELRQYLLIPVWCSSVAPSCLTLCDPMDCSSQASLSFTIPQSLLKLMSIELVMLSNHLILCHPLLFWPLIFPSIRVFSNESSLCIRWPKYWSFSFSINPSNDYSGFISFRIVNPCYHCHTRPLISPP